MNPRQTFWITNGVNSSDDFKVIVKCNEKVKCNHCYNIRNGFVELGNDTPLELLRYAICNSCLYNPATNMVNNLFIAVSKNKNPERFNEMLNSYDMDEKNKKMYLELLS